MAKVWYESKTLQCIMGHSDIGVTLNTYTHLQFEDALEEMKKGCGLKDLKIAQYLAQNEGKVMQSYSKIC